MSGKIELNTGRFFHVGGAGNCVLGISVDLEVYEGYDHNNDEWDGNKYFDDVVGMTAAEKAEVCDVMINRWRRLKELLLKTPTRG